MRGGDESGDDCDAEDKPGKGDELGMQLKMGIGTRLGLGMGLDLLDM